MTTTDTTFPVDDNFQELLDQAQQVADEKDEKTSSDDTTQTPA